MGGAWACPLFGVGPLAPPCLFVAVGRVGVGVAPGAGPAVRRAVGLLGAHWVLAPAVERGLYGSSLIVL